MAAYTVHHSTGCGFVCLIQQSLPPVSHMESGDLWRCGWGGDGSRVVFYHTGGANTSFSQDSSLADLRVFSGERYESHSEHSVVWIHSDQIRSKKQTTKAGNKSSVIFSKTPVETDGKNHICTHIYTHVHTHTHIQTHWSFIIWTVLVDTQAQNSVLVDQRSEFHLFIRTTTWPSTHPLPALPLDCPLRS